MDELTESPARFEGTTMVTERLRLEPLRPDDADEMFEVLADERLHEYIGGRPATLEELRSRYIELATGSGDSNEIWLNWIARRSSDSQPVGYVQATIVDDDDGRRAEIAWVIGVGWQNRGYASEAATGLVDWIRSRGVHHIEAHVHPDHAASARVATRADLRLTDEEVDGEQVWRAGAG